MILLINTVSVVAFLGLIALLADIARPEHTKAANLGDVMEFFLIPVLLILVLWGPIFTCMEEGWP